jgi:Recombination endonuclease VII
MAEPIQTLLWPDTLTRAEARQAGRKVYFTGRPCKYGHVLGRRVDTTRCVECFRINSRKQAAYNRAWRKANQDKVKAFKSAWKNANPEKQKEMERRSRHKVSQDPQRYRLVKAQKVDWRARRLIEKAQRERPDCCEVCGQMAEICFDHCHKTGQFRGWLCHSCNCILGFAKDSGALLRRLANYLDQHARQAEQAQNGNASGTPEES